jgi:hypothetical protein
VQRVVTNTWRSTCPSHGHIGGARHNGESFREVTGNRPPRTRQPSPRPNQPAVTLDNCTPTGSRKRPRCPQMLLPPASRNALPAGRIRAWPRPLERLLPWRENTGRSP